VRLDITLDSARRAFRAATFSRTTDGDGLPLVEVARANTSLMILDAGEDDAEAPVDWNRKIEGIETFSPLCRQSDGIGPETLVTETVRILGPVQRIVLGEMESRQFIEFERQPAGVTLRLDYTGRFEEGARETTRYAPGAKILSVTVTRPR
jgi:hypothetical protein